MTWDYGADFIELAERWSGYQTSAYWLHDRRLGIDGAFMDVFVMVKDEMNSVCSANSPAIRTVESFEK